MKQAYTPHKVRHIENLREMLTTSATLYGENIAFSQNESGNWRSYTFAQYGRDVNSLCLALDDELQKASGKPLAGQKILVSGENCYAWVVAYMTAMTAAATVVPLDKEMAAGDVQNVIDMTKPAVIVYSDTLSAKFDGMCSDAIRIPFSELGDWLARGAALLDAGQRGALDAPIDEDAVASIIFTSGTTGASKGVMLSQRNLYSNVRNALMMVYEDEHDVLLSVLPLHHVYECTIGFLCSLCSGAQVAFSTGLRYLMKEMKTVRPTAILCVPLLLETVYQKIWTNIRKKGMEKKVRTAIALTEPIRPLSARQAARKKLFAEIHETFGGRIRLMVSGGAGIDPAILKGLRDLGFHAIQGYGLTECSPLAAVNHSDYFEDSAAGLALPEGQLRIADAAEDGTGEICVRSEGVMLGYYNMPEATAAVKHGGWFYTGDLGYIDKRGFLHITGRKKNVIVTYNGKNIFPEELEAHLCRSDAVAEAVVVGIMNEKKKDYDIVALLRPDMDRLRELSGGEVSEEQVELALSAALESVNATVQSYKHMCMYIHYREEFPKNSSKKIKRASLIEKILPQYEEKMRR
ncbi:MAG: AMP-binding protein [Clostridia bacterium]|nr:AMP-binding protein [Clostridia bacterium]